MSSAEPATSLVPGTLKATPEDFVVEEIPAYEPSGTGEHLFVTFTKSDLTTPEAIRRLARALDCDPRAAGAAGMKDKRAVTTQTVSLHLGHGLPSSEVVARAQRLDLEGIQVHRAAAHGHKIKAGHLAGNRFTIVVRNIPSGRFAQAAQALDTCARDGVPNGFGAQRFGNAGDNAERALAWLRGGKRPTRDKRLLRLLWSSLQASVFNAVLRERLRDGTWATPFDGDLLKIHASGGLFVCSDATREGRRAQAGEVSPTGPIVGPRMRRPTGVIADLEDRIATQMLGPDFDFSPVHGLGDGTRRALRLWIRELRCERLDVDARGEGHGANACMRVGFVLPKGAYATTVLAAAFAIEEPVPSDASRDETPPREEEELS